MSGVEDHGIGGGMHRSEVAAGISAVAFFLSVKHFFKCDRFALGSKST